MKDDNEFDRVLDDALAEYRAAEPLAGMEHRVLQRVRMQAERRKAWLRCSAFAACAATLAVAAWIGLHSRGRPEIVPAQPTTAQQQKPPVGLQPSNENTHAANRGPAPRRVLIAKAMLSRRPNIPGQPAPARTEQAPIGQQFPSPTPLSSQERALLALAQSHPEVLRRLPSNQDDREIAIAPINIQPLVSKTSDDQGED